MHRFTSFQPYDRVTGTELSRQQQEECQQYYLAIKSYVDGIKRHTKVSSTWTRTQLRCSTAELLESMCRVSNEIKDARLDADDNGTNGLEESEETDNEESAFRAKDTARYAEAVNLLHELVSRLADVHGHNTLAIPSDTALPRRLSVQNDSTPSSGSRASDVLASSVQTRSSHSSSNLIEPSQPSQDLLDQSDEATNSTLPNEPASFISSASYQRTKVQATSDWVLEYMRGGWLSYSPATTPEATISPPPGRYSPATGSFGQIQRTSSDLSTLSEDGTTHAHQGGMSRRALPIPTIVSRLKRAPHRDNDPFETHTYSSIASGFEHFQTPPSIMSGGTVFCTPEGAERLLPAVQPSTISAWSKYLRQKGLIPLPFEEMDWSGRGQHAEFDIAEESTIPLTLERALGHSKDALVESVRCRRIRLARKTVKVSRRLKKEEAMKEVEHLQRLKHSHIIRVVGTYTLPRTLSILLYPVAQYTLDAFLESLQDESLHDPTGDERASRLYSTSTFLRCLAKALAYIHEQAMKHMDIKPKNLLVRDLRNSTICNQGKYKIYIADFGITRSYRSIDDCDTESPTSYTKKYAAPEVIAQERRDQKADIFSLGAVYAEMLAVLSNETNPMLSNVDMLHEIREGNPVDRSYAARAPRIRTWLRNLSLTTYGFESDTEHSHITELVARMLSEDPVERPTAATVMTNIPFLAFCCDVNGGPEPFEAADRREGRQLYDRALELSEADEKYWRCVVEGCVKVFTSREKLEYHAAYGHGEIKETILGAADTKTAADSYSTKDQDTEVHSAWSTF